MSDTSSQQEPSMEEILASIRRIISEDGDEAEGAAEAAADDAADESADGDEDDDVLELTDEIAEEERDEPTILAEPEEDPEPEVEEPTIVAEPEPEEQVEEPTILAEDDSDPIISDEPAAQAANAIAGLMTQIQSDTRLGNRDATIEQIVRELLRPMLKEWLDANLPEMTERIVREEIERVVARSR